MRPEYGGGEIWSDDRLIRRTAFSWWTNPKHLNPDRLW